MTVYIYGLWDPRTYELRYIGRTYNPEQRLYGHIYEAQKELNINSYKDRWIRQLLKENLEPSFEILEECTEDNWVEIEKVWIKEGKEKGLRLTNITAGGEGFGVGENHPCFGKHLSEEHKRKISEINIKTGKRPPRFSELSKEKQDAAKQKMSKTRKGRPSPNVGRKWSQEYKDKMSQSLSGKNNPMFGKFGKDHPATGRIVTEETRKNLSQSLIGKKLGMKHSEETKRKLSILSKGRKQTEDTKRKRSLSEKMHYANKKGLIDKVIILQNEYFNLFGVYHPRYIHK